MRDYAEMLARPEPPVRIAFDMLDEMTKPGWIRKGDRGPDTSLSVRLPAMDLTMRINLASNTQDIDICHLLDGELVGRLVLPQGGRRDLLVDDEGIDALIADLARPAIAILGREALDASELRRVQETCTVIEDIAAAAVSMARAKENSLFFLDLPSPWNEAGIHILGDDADRILDPECMRRIRDLGRTIPHFVVMDQNDVSEDPEMRYDVTIKNRMVMLKRRPPIEAMRIMAKHA